MKALKKGMTLPDFKYGSLSTTKIQFLSPPRFVKFLLAQSVAHSSFSIPNRGSELVLNPLVQEGDYVLTGTKIAEHPDFNSAPLHSSVSGRVRKVRDESILIESDEVDKLDTSIDIRSELPSNPDHLIELIRQAGVVDLGGTAFPTHSRLVEARKQKIDTLVINGCESEPFLTSDHVLMLNHPVEVLKGIELLRIASGASRAVIATERNKLEVVEILNTKNYNLKFNAIEIAHFPVRYPQGAERALAESILGKELAYQQNAIQAGVLVENVATAFAVYEAVYLNKPLYERVVTITGPCVIEPKNVWARIGTKASDLIRCAKGFLREPGRVIFGGPLTGEAIASLERPMTKKVQGLVALSPDLLDTAAEQACTRCAKCVEVCPESLVPETLMRAVKKGNHNLALEYDINSCTECGLCSYICPSHIPLVPLIKSGKMTTQYSSHQPAYAVHSQNQSG